MRFDAFALAVVIASAPTAAGATTVSEFVARDTELGAKGITDPAAPEIAAQNAVIGAAINKFRATIAAEAAAGKPAATCLPPPGEGRLSGGDIIAWFKAMAQNDAAMSVDDAITALLRARYPCNK